MTLLRRIYNKYIINIVIEYDLFTKFNYSKQYYNKIYILLIKIILLTLVLKFNINQRLEF